MSRPSYVFAAACALACLGLVSFLLLDIRIPAAAAKLIASSAFIATAVSAGALESLYGRVILWGLALSWCGDMLLIGRGELFFLAGLVAFLLAHVAYIVAFTVHGTHRRWLFAAIIPIAIVASLVSAWLTPHISAELLIPVRVYTVVISLMVVMAIATRGAGGSLLVLIGALLFYMSDLSVAALRLVQTDFPTYAWGLPFYYGGQLCLALSVASQSSSQYGIPAK